MLDEPRETNSTERKLEIAMRIREARVRAHMTQDDAAELLGCSLKRYNRIERADGDLSLFEAEKLAKGFNVPVTFFLRQLAEYA